MSHRLPHSLQKIPILEIIREYLLSLSLPSHPLKTCQPVVSLQFHDDSLAATCCSTCWKRVGGVACESDIFGIVAEEKTARVWKKNLQMLNGLRA